MTTYYPQSATQHSDHPDIDIAWAHYPVSYENYLLNSRWKTVAPLKHRSNPASGDLTDSTWSIICTKFQIPTLEYISGLQLTVNAQRNGRIVDDTIQLTYQGSPIGANNFSYTLDSDGHFLLLNETVYGDETDQWGVELTPEMVSDESFGVILKFQSHPFYPHSCDMFVDSVSLTVFA
jgi:hypothetical protein